MQSFNKNKKSKIQLKNRRFKKLTMFKLQNCAGNGLWGNWVSKRNIYQDIKYQNKFILISRKMLYDF